MLAAMRLRFSEVYALPILVYLCTVQCVTCELREILLTGKNTSQSTEHYSMFCPENAVDGRLDTFSYTVPLTDPHPWWKVDLGREHIVSSVSVTLKGNCCGSRFIGATARAGQSSEVLTNAQCGTPATKEQSKTGATVLFRCDPPLQSQFVSLDINRSLATHPTSALHILEVDLKNDTNHTIPVTGKHASQSTNLKDFFAPMAIDGDLATYSATALSNLNEHPWWLLDMTHTYTVTTVNLTLRAGCCVYRTVGALVRAGNDSNLFKNQQCGVPLRGENARLGRVIQYPCNPPVYARYISVDINPNELGVIHQGLQIAEVTVEVVENKTLSLIGMKTSQISTQGSTIKAKNAIDGKGGTSAITALGDPHPWWRLDLGDEHCLGKVQVQLSGSNANNFVGGVARAGISPEVTKNQKCGTPVTPSAQSNTGEGKEFVCAPPVMARYVSVDVDPTITSQAIMEFSELEVWEYTSGECSNNSTKEETVINPSLKSADYIMFYKGGFVENASPLSVNKVGSRVRCAGYCTADARCSSFDFSSRQRRCRLYNLNSTDIEVAHDNDFSIYIFNI